MTSFIWVYGILFLVINVYGFKKYDFTGQENSENLQNLSENFPLTSRIHRLPPRYSEHYFTAFQPNIETETKTNVTYPTNITSFFGPQSYWSQFAHRIVDDVVGQVGGIYVKKNEKSEEFKQALKELAKSDSNSSSETLEKFRKALKMENETRLHSDGRESMEKKGYISVEDVGKENSKSSESSSLEIDQFQEPRIVEFVRPKKNRTKLYSAQIEENLKLAEIVYPTRSPPISKSSSFENTDYGILPNLLLKNPNARNRFYHLEKYANPQFPIPKINEFGNSKKMAPKKNPPEIRRSPLRTSVERIRELQSKSRETKQEWDSISNEIRFRSALKKILASYRKEHSISSLPNWSRERQLERLAYRKSSESNIRRHPANHRRTVFLPARYETEESFARWRH